MRASMKGVDRTVHTSGVRSWVRVPPRPYAEERAPVPKAGEQGVDASLRDSCQAPEMGGLTMDGRPTTANPPPTDSLPGED